MIICFFLGTQQGEIEPVKKNLEEKGIHMQDVVVNSEYRIGLIGDTSNVAENALLQFSCIKEIKQIQEPYTLAGRTFQPSDTVIEVFGGKIGGGNFSVIAGPCAVESEAQVLEIAKCVKASGANFLRGGAFKPRTSPHAFRGLGLEGLEILKETKRITGLPIVTELMSPEHLEIFAECVDVIQIGSRNMQNFSLLHQVGRLNKPVLLKRGLSATIEELLMVAEHIMVHGNQQVILCERGIRTFENATRNTLDLSAVPVIKSKSHLPVIIDPSHATGYWQYVEPMTLAAVAAGCDGLIIEVHNNPNAALCDGAQSITPQVFEGLMQQVTRIRNVITSEAA